MPWCSLPWKRNEFPRQACAASVPHHKQARNKQPFYAARIQNKSKKHTFIMTHLSPSRFSYPPCTPAMREEEEEVQQQTMHAPTNRNTAQYAQRNFQVRSVPLVVACLG
jgi:putative hemolysin